MPFAAALSEHPLATHAVGEVVGEVLERLGPAPDLAVLFVTAPHAGVMEDMAAAVRSLLGPRVLLGATAVSVVGGRREIEETSAVSLWGGRFPGAVTPVRLTARPGPDGPVVAGLPGALDDARTLLLLPDPFTFPADALLDDLRERWPALAVVGGLASAARGPGGNRLVLDCRVWSDGAVGVLLDEAVAPVSVVSQGCRPVGEPFIVTRSERNVLYELGGRPALERLEAIARSLPEDERLLMARGLHIGVVIDERKDAFERGDFLIRGVLGADRSVGALAIGDVVPVGTTVQFQVRDADAADEDLRWMLQDRSADGALVFTCNGRGSHLFGSPDHDAALVADGLGIDAVAGMFCAGELGPVGGRSFLHGFTASIALFNDRD